MEGLVRDLDRFSRFLEAVSFSHAQLLNVSNVARDSGVGRKAVEGYVGVLEDLLLSFRLPVFRKRAARATVAHHKLYLFDCGVFRWLRPAGPLARPAEIAGAALEGLVAQHLRAWLAYRNPVPVRRWTSSSMGAGYSAPSKSSTAPRCGAPIGARCAPSTPTTARRSACCSTWGMRPCTSMACSVCHADDSFAPWIRATVSPRA